MLTKRYMVSTKNLGNIMKKIVAGTAPAKFTVAHLKSIGFASSNDQPAIGLLKDLKFLAPDGTPLQRYHDYRDPSRSKAIMAEAIREAYEDIFHINETPSPADREAIVGKFKSSHNVSDEIAGRQAQTFLALLPLADLGARSGTSAPPQQQGTPSEEHPGKGRKKVDQGAAPTCPFTGLHYNIQIHLPATKDLEVYNAIFKSLRVHLFET